MTAALAAALAGCGGGTDAAAPQDTPSASQTPSPSGPETTPAAQQKQDVLAVVSRFHASALRAYKVMTVEPMAETATPRFAAHVLDNYRENIKGAGNTVLGGPRIIKDTAKVEIDGTTATLDICVDNTQTFIVPAGTKTVGVGAVGGSRDIQTFTLQLRDGAWLIDKATSDGKAC